MRVIANGKFTFYENGPAHLSMMKNNSTSATTDGKRFYVSENFKAFFGNLSRKSLSTIFKNIVLQRLNFTEKSIFISRTSNRKGSKKTLQTSVQTTQEFPKFEE